jgi:carbonic anhydrase
LSPFIKKHHFHARATDDLFVMAIECTDKTNDAELQSFLEKAGAKEVNIQVAETGWWIGRYDREQKLYREEKGY